MIWPSTGARSSNDPDQFLHWRVELDRGIDGFTLVHRAVTIVNTVFATRPQRLAAAHLGTRDVRRPARLERIAGAVYAGD